MEKTSPKLIHVAMHYLTPVWSYLYLRKIAPNHFIWFEDTATGEKETLVEATSAEEALRLASRTWKEAHFKTLMCGFRYTLPERDEHGMNALFHQMAASYNSMNGVYFDEEVGHNCFVQNASMDALSLLKKLSKEKRL